MCGQTLVIDGGCLAPTGRLLEQSEADWDRTIDVDLKGVFLTLKAEIAPMVTAAGGAIINTASVAGVIADPYGAVRRRQARCAWTDEGGRAGYACQGHRAEFHHRWGAGR